jgi:hypothetical protein
MHARHQPRVGLGLLEALAQPLLVVGTRVIAMCAWSAISSLRSVA